MQTTLFFDRLIYELKKHQFSINCCNNKLMTLNNILVTGGCGFIGSNFVRYLLKSKPDCIISNLDALTYAGNPLNLADISDEQKKRYQFVHGDIRDVTLLERLFKENMFDAVVHFAAESHVDRSIEGPHAFVDTNVNGTFCLLEAGLKSWEAHSRFPHFRFLHISTDEVYGSLGKEGYFTETTPYDPSSPYSASKASSDHFVNAYFRTFGLPTLITNCSNNYGPYQFPEKLIPLMILNIVENKPLPVYGDGSNVRDWLYVLDHCDAILKVLEKGKPGETYNIGGGSEYKNIDLVNLLCEILDEHLSRSGQNSSRNLIEFVTDRLGHDQRYAIDASKIEKDLGWKPKHHFSEAIKKTVNWYLEHMNWVNTVRSGEYKSG